jgi:thioesterase domain-containing protein
LRFDTHSGIASSQKQALIELPDLNWSQVVTGGVEIIQIPGNHGSILQRPNVDLLATQVQAILNTN